MKNDLKGGKWWLGSEYFLSLVCVHMIFDEYVVVGGDRWLLGKTNPYP